MITILQIEFGIDEIVKVTFINEKGTFEMVHISNELMFKLLDMDKLKLAIKGR